MALAFYRFQRVPMTDKIFFLQNLYIMTKAGVPLDKALAAIAEQSQNNKLRAILAELQQKISQGQNLSDGLKSHQDEFGELFINMIMAGEASGTLEQVLGKLYLQIKKEHQLNLRIRNALTYPAIILTVMLIICTFIVVVILPEITKIFLGYNVRLPLITQLLITLSDFISHNGWLVLIIIIVLIFLLIQSLRTKLGKTIYDWLALKLPVVSGIVKEVNMARICRSLSSLISTDIPIVNNLNITSRLTGNLIYRQALQDTAEQVKKGQKIHQIWRSKMPLFPPIAIQMMAIGEETGMMDAIASNLADFYEEEVFQTMDNLPSIIEPILILIMGLGVALIALAVLLPMYALIQSF